MEIKGEGRWSLRWGIMYSSGLPQLLALEEQSNPESWRRSTYDYIKLTGGSVWWHMISHWHRI